MAGRPRAIDRALKAQEAAEPKPGTRPTAEVRAEVTELLKPTEPRRVPATLMRAVREETWRQRLLKITKGHDELLQGLVDIAHGKAWIPVLPDGREGPPQVPSSSDRLAANIHLTNMLYGKPVPQTEIIAAEKQTEDQARLKALSDVELHALVKKHLLAESNTEEADFAPVAPIETPNEENEDGDE